MKDTQVLTEKQVFDLLDQLDEEIDDIQASLNELRLDARFFREYLKQTAGYRV